jgi:hypothetical protein
VDHDYQIEKHPIMPDANPAKALNKEIPDRNIRTIVKGHAGSMLPAWISRLLFGFTTRALLEDPTCALFVYQWRTTDLRQAFAD